MDAGQCHLRVRWELAQSPICQNCWLRCLWVGGALFGLFPGAFHLRGHKLNGFSLGSESHLLVVSSCWIGTATCSLDCSINSAMNLTHKKPYLALKIKKLTLNRYCRNIGHSLVFSFFEAEHWSLDYMMGNLYLYRDNDILLLNPSLLPFLILASTFQVQKNSHFPVKNGKNVLDINFRSRFSHDWFGCGLNFKK